MRTVKSGDWVKMHYVCSLENGEVVDTSKGLPPVEFQIPKNSDGNGFDAEIIGMAINEEKEFVLLPDQHVGYSVDGKNMEIPLAKINAEVEFTVGRVMLLSFTSGQKLPGTVTEVKKDSIIVDFNHPLAGKELKYKVQVLEINDRQTGTFSCKKPANEFFIGTDCCT